MLLARRVAPGGAQFVELQVGPLFRGGDPRKAGQPACGLGRPTVCDARSRQRLGQTERKIVHRGLRCAIWAKFRVSLDSVSRRYLDGAAPSTLAHGRDKGLGQLHRR